MKIGKQVVVYGASVALNRGGILLCTPFLVAWFGLVDFGIYSLTLVAAQLLANLLSLNGGTAVMREGAESPAKGAFLYRRFTGLTILVGTLLALVTWPFDHSSSHWVGYAVLLGIVEGLQQLLLNWLRCRNRQYAFLTYAILRTVGIMVVIGWVRQQQGNLESLLLAQFAWSLGLVAIFGVLADIGSKRETGQQVAMLGVLKYALPMIPHAAAQWVISGSDRLVIKWLASEESLGTYSMAYSFAMVVMLVNSGMALTLPQQIVQNYDRWTIGTIRSKALIYYTAIVVALMMTILLALECDRRTVQWFTTGSAEVPAIVGLVGAGLYLQGIYYLYGNFYFYHRRTGKLATQTTIAALLNIGLTLVFVNLFGIVGAAVATFLTYGIYLAMLLNGLKTIEPRLMTMLQSDLKIVPASVAGLFFLGIMQAYYWN